MEALYAQPARGRESLELQVQTSFEYVESATSLVARAVAVLETAAAESEAQGDAERAAVCRDFAARFRAHPHPAHVDDDTWLEFQLRCAGWPGIATPHFHALLHGCVHVEDIEENSDDE